MAKFGLSQSIRRVEDPRLLKGGGRYTDDVAVTGQAQGYVLRSPHAHAKIVSIDTAAAKAMPGVLGVWTAADLAASGIGNLPCLAPVKSVDGSPTSDTPHPVLADGVVRYVGDPVAFIAAETITQARDAAEAIEVDYDVLPAATDLATATEPGQPQVWASAPNNTCF
ncbi:MAG TPA: xanthine dehydrogenase family protein molybdopterin-binding subunit, partial [Roseomonas sp.]|nr:xanthine dehydrogenase family protein molybdopterin-binding subunit [Roseomonas sp.]